jgi:transposase
MERGKKRLQKLRERRMKAVALFEQGERQATIAHILRVSHQSASESCLAWRNGDTDALNGAKKAGRKPRLQPEQLALVERGLLRGARAHGYSADLSTLPRVAKLISTVTDVDDHPGHVWKILRKMGWGLERPTLRAKERDEAKIRQWKEESWPEVKKELKPGGPG